MYDWLGFKTGFPLSRSWKRNKHLQRDVERTFEGISETRKQILEDWATETWEAMHRLEQQLINKGVHQFYVNESREDIIIPLLYKAMEQSIDITELFILDTQFEVIATTHKPHLSTRYGLGSILEPALTYMSKQPVGEPLLFGPYCDQWTLQIGSKSSAFHDKVTLMFILPIVSDGETTAYLCGRVPNDVIGDLIQREAGHVYPDSGDNYLFMAKPVLLQSVEVGTALSRSRFEDKTFTMGENLKDGVTTAFGTVSVKEHTELELMFINPANKQLHPGVANTISKGSNLFVEFPAYPDYRYIPVIGKGCTLQLPHCPDVWGLMCEGDFEEVYRIRSLGTKRRTIQAYGIAAISILSALAVLSLNQWLAPWAIALIVGGLQLIIGFTLLRITFNKEDKREIKQIRKVKKFIQSNAEGKSDLTKRLDLAQFNNDEIKDIAKWLNNMMDTLEGIMLQVNKAAGNVSSSQSLLNETAKNTTHSTQRVSEQVTQMIASTRTQLDDIEQVREMADFMRMTLNQMEEKAISQLNVAQSEVDRIGEKMKQISSTVNTTNQSLHDFIDTTEEIKNVIGVIEGISSQTHLLALNASIEAAHVGELGSGFAVVASEIRKLANSTKESTEQVYRIMDKIYQNAQNAFSSMEQGNAVVLEGNQLVETVAGTLAVASTYDDRKTEMVDQVVQLLESIAQVSRKNGKVSSSVEKKVYQLSEEMNNVQDTSVKVDSITNQLHQLVAQFKLTTDRLR